MINRVATRLAATTCCIRLVLAATDSTVPAAKLEAGVVRIRLAWR